MDTPSATTKYKNHRCPIEIISHAVWLYFRFCLSFRDVEELLFERGVLVTYEAMRKWCRKFGQPYANERIKMLGITQPEQCPLSENLDTSDEGWKLTYCSRS